MNRSSLLIAAISSFSALAFSCSKKINSQRLNGEWEWVRTDGGIGYHIHETPNSTGKFLRLEFTEDNKYRVTENGSLFSQGTYSLKMRRCIHEAKEKLFIDFSRDSDQDLMIEKIDNKNLSLSDENSDGLEMQYARRGGGND